MSQTTVKGGGAFTKKNITDINANFTELYNSGVAGALTSAHLFVGSGSNVATDTALSGDASITNLGALTVTGVNGSATSKTGAQINALPTAVATGYKIARSAAAVAVTGTLDVDTGLTTVLGWGVTMESDPDGVALAAVSAAAGAAGHITIKCWKVTATNDATLIAATAAKNVRWVAIGT